MTLVNGGENGSWIDIGIIFRPISKWKIIPNFIKSKKYALSRASYLSLLFSILYGMVFALIGVFFSRCKIYDESNEGSFIGNSITNMSISNNAVSNHNNNGHNNNMNGGKLKLLVQKPCFKIIVGLLSLGGIIAYSIFANMCYYKLNCEEIHPYIVFIPVSLFLTYVRFL